jgi:germination protein M
MRKRLDQSIGFIRGGVLLFLVVILSACSQSPKPNQEVTAQIDPPPLALEQEMMGDKTVSQQYSEGNDVVTVYLLDQHGYLAPMSLRVDGESTSAEATVAKAIQWMTADKQRADQLPTGFQAILPVGTELGSVTEHLTDRTISVDFKSPFPEVPAAQERKVLEALVWTLTELPGIDKVKLSIAGQPLDVLPSSGLSVDPLLTRGLGINLETAKGVQINRSMAVTLFFSSQSIDGEGYFVPVTRLIDRQENVTKAALEQLILGPLDANQLSPILMKDTKIEKLSQLADTINVSLRDNSSEFKSAINSNRMEALVLTLTEASGAPQVSLVMNGNDTLIDTNERPYEQPLTRPTSINVLQR